ncbi:hypothetical protein PC113_g17886 [Phytophthora cactorum]|uniref:Tc1-like transposase DDE domain-containing protein n=3 Tax=Phytophthora cactorum TaxID=29920 RepID=A0A8T0YAC4_9STRA|nr:hypothetical protein PC113_g17886 [Phytophthora cactorum]
MNKAENKNKWKEFVNKLEEHASRRDMIVFHDETNFNMYLSRNEGYSRVGERATVALTPSQGMPASSPISSRLHWGRRTTETLATEMLAADGIVSANKLVVLRLAPYSPMLDPIEGCWNVLKAKMCRFMAERKEEFLVRGEYETFCAHRRALMEEDVEFAKSAITRRLVWRMERHCLKASFAAGRGEDMELGK